MKCATCGIDKEEYSGRFRINIRSCEKCYMKEYNRKKRSPESYEKTRMRTKNIRYFKYHTDPEFRQKAIENAERWNKENREKHLKSQRKCWDRDKEYWNFTKRHKI